MSSTCQAAHPCWLQELQLAVQRRRYLSPAVVQAPTMPLCRWRRSRARCPRQTSQPSSSRSSASLAPCTPIAWTLSTRSWPPANRRALERGLKPYTLNPDPSSDARLKTTHLIAMEHGCICASLGRTADHMCAGLVMARAFAILLALAVSQPWVIGSCIVCWRPAHGADLELCSGDDALCYAPRAIVL